MRETHLLGFNSESRKGIKISEETRQKLRESHKGQKSPNLRHGESRTRFYGIWKGIMGRCYCKSNRAYKGYGDQGISVSERWLIFENFREDMLTKYNNHVKKFGEKNTSIERIDSSGNYCKENCRWATNLEQANNKSNSLFVEFDGLKLTLPQWSRKLKIPFGRLRGRYIRGKRGKELFKEWLTTNYQA